MHNSTCKENKRFNSITQKKSKDMTRKLLFALVLLLLVGCQEKIIEWTDDNRSNPDGSVGFRLQTEDTEIKTDDAQTKGTPHNSLEKYDTVCVNVFSHTSDYEATTNNDVKFFQNIKLKQEVTNWECIPPMFWPVGQKLSFFAYASDIAFADAGITFDPSPEESDNIVPDNIIYKVPSDVTKQPDLFVATKFNQPQVGNVSLNMKHALACVSFCGVAPEKGTYVKSITLRNVYCEGMLALNDSSIAWTVNPESKGVTVFEAGIKKDEELGKDPLPDNNYLMTADGYLMMIPQKLKDAAIDVLYWNKKDDTENKVITYTLPIDDESYATWKPGLKYIYKFGNQSKEDITVVYYEKYKDESYGFQSNNGTLPRLDEVKEIIEAGYGVLSKSEPITTIPKIKLGLRGTPIESKKVEAVEGEYDLYAVSQTSINNSATFNLPNTSTPVEVYFDGSSVPCGKIIPHFAKGVSDIPLSNYAIRTPQQMQNISALTSISAFNANATLNKEFEQERDLDFSKQNIGGSILNGAVVDETFSGTYNGVSKSILNLTISASGVSYVGLFSQNAGILNDITLKASSIEGKNNVGGIAGRNHGDRGAVNRPRIIGTSNNPKGQVNIIGTNYVGGIVGYNEAIILGNDATEAATEITVAEVSGWVNIRGSSDFVGGIAGENGYVSSISRVLVNGVYITGSTLGDLTQSKIVITGTNYVGGIVGNNTLTAKVNGNVTGSGTIDIKNMPDVAGIVEIRATANWVGGITGKNVGELNSVNIRLGRTPAMIIEGINNVGGIVGENEGTLGVQSDNTFISTRGNIEISGSNNVGGIVGKNSSNAELKNCFVYDFYTQGNNSKVYYAPTIKASDSNVGGIAGSNEAAITNSSVFSASNTATSGIIITAGVNNAGGLVGANSTGGNTTACSLVGNIKIEAKIQAAGGILGDNKSGTTITNCWIGSSDRNEIIKKAGEKLGLVITPPGVSSPSYGTPSIAGNTYIGGIVGLNDGGIINGIKLADNVIIGRKAGSAVDDGSNWVGGIAGGNTPSGDGLTSTIQYCSVENTEKTTVIIQGSRNLGGIVGLNNGIIKDNTVSGIASNPFKIIGLGTIGGIVGQGGSDLGGTGNRNTLVENCHVTGYVVIQGNITASGFITATEVGGIIGLNGVAADGFNNVRTCTVKGNTANSISISGDGTTGGIAGTNSGNLYKCEVSNAHIRSTGAPAYSFEPKAPKPYAGGITGMTTITAATTTTSLLARSNIDQCIVYATVNIDSYWFGYTAEYAGALIGYLNSTVVISLGDPSYPNKVNNSNVRVNRDYIPTQNNYIVGFTTGEGGSDRATIHHTVAP